MLLPVVSFLVRYVFSSFVAMRFQLLWVSSEMLAYLILFTGTLYFSILISYCNKAGFTEHCHLSM